MAQRKLLLADDSITIQKVVNLTFADEGIEVVTVGDGDAAMEKMSEFSPDLVLADVNMPGLNGYQVCEKIKQTDQFSKTPVILLVGSFEPFDESEAQRVGADDFLTKPFQSIRQLVSKVTELLDADNASTKKEAAEPLPVAPDNSNFSGGENTGFNDAGADDEMIETNHSGGFGLDETGKFETRETYEATEESAAAPPFHGEEIKQFAYSSPAEETSPVGQKDAAHSPSAEYVSAETDFHENALKETKSESAKPALELDFEDDFLELPPEEIFDEDEQTSEESENELPPEIPETQPETDESNKTSTEDQQATHEPEQSEHYEMKDSSELAEDHAQKTGEDFGFAQIPEQAETFDASAEDQPTAASFVASSELSSETIDIIVQKVVEKLSDKVVREIAREVVPQMTELIVRKMAEEKMKGS